MGKARLSKADCEALCEPWKALKKVLLNVASLYIPPPGAPLVLCTDAAGARVGTVLLAQRSDDPEDLAPVCYFSCAFGSKQGHKHLTWCEAFVVFEAVKYFYPYLDGCANLCIKTDCCTVVSLFLHKTTSDTDQLAQFKLGLMAYRVKKYMIVHQKGEDQQMADWLLWAKEWLRLDKLPATDTPDPAETTIGGNDIEYAIGPLSAADPGPNTGPWSQTVGHHSGEDANSDHKEDGEPPGDNATPSSSLSEADSGMPMHAQQYGSLVRALHLPRPTEFTNCQETDEEIQLWM
ncbi:hypothetical protein H4R20_000955 [Coemansia guatemalensis]|uniref:Reverse transcriptase/retrotransposon-derived protein RNase H-like domain-containing protein n=1 Tax=Coemansia guatemalensis TaxID=2761395 RepID=A0A9W8I048_9FUNG|nr:hypothetical protein H4R20_000955 [Coemansia guatemalensis]